MIECCYQIYERKGKQMRRYQFDSNPREVHVSIDNLNALPNGTAYLEPALAPFGEISFCYLNGIMYSLDALLAAQASLRRRHEI